MDNTIELNDLIYAGAKVGSGKVNSSTNGTQTEIQ